MWNRFMAFLATLIFIAGGILLLAILEGSFIGVNEVMTFIESSYTDLNTRFAIFLIGSCALLLGLFNVYRAILRFRRKSYVDIHGKNGNIQIAHKSIEGIVEKIRRETDGIEKISTRITSGRKKVSLEIRLFLGNVRNVIDLSRRVQEQVKADMENVLGISNIGEIRISVRRLSLEKEKSYEDILEGRRTSRGIELNR